MVPRTGQISLEHPTLIIITEPIATCNFLVRQSIPTGGKE